MNVVAVIAGRLMLEIVRDRRTLALFLLMPVVVMSLIYFALSTDETARVAVMARGVARLFVYDLERALEEEDGVELAYLSIPDDVRGKETLHRMIREALRAGEADGVLLFGEELLTDRFEGQPGTLYLFLEGSRPTLNALVASAVASAADDLGASLPLVIDADCSAKCANSVNVRPLQVERVYLYGSEDLRQIDFFLPVLAPFFVFFLTFLVACVTFQRERVRGTLERLLIAPVSLSQVVLGYVLGFLLFSSAQAAIVIAYLLALIGIPVGGLQVLYLGLITLLVMLTALLLGLLVSFAARNEFQAVQFMPVVILPQVFLADMIWSIDSFPAAFRWVAYGLPLTHANIAVRNVLLKGQPLADSWLHLVALGAMFFVLLGALALVGRHAARLAS